MDFYLESADVLKSLEEKKGTLKNLIYASPISNKKKLQAFISGVAKMISILKELVKNQKAGKINNRKTGSNKGGRDTEALCRNNQHLLLVSLFEYYFGVSDQLPDALKSHLEQQHSTFEHTLAGIRSKWKATNDQQLFTIVSQQQSTYHLPRYVRVNTIKKSTSDVIETLLYDGWKLLPAHPDDDYLAHMKEVSRLEGDFFMRDPHVPDLLVFPHGTPFHEDPLFLNGDVILQDKASCMAALALCPPVDAVALDACAAPGNKTSYLAALMRNTGKIIAFDMDKERFRLMQTMLQKAGVSVVAANNCDFLTTRPHAPPFTDVEYILVDPSCSGSGIIDRQDIVQSEAERPEIQQRRIKSLSNFQAMTLNHALKFPIVKRVVYSTCSVHRQENEEVVLEALAKNQKFKLQTIFEKIPSRGKNKKNKNNNNKNNSNGADDDEADMRRCVRLGPDDDLTNGFFIACFVRKGDDYDNDANNKSNINSDGVDDDSSRRRKKRKRGKVNGEMSGPNKIIKININNTSNSENLGRGGVDDDRIESNPLHMLSMQSKKQLIDDDAKNKKNYKNKNNNNKEKNEKNNNNIKNTNSNDKNADVKRERKLLKKKRSRQQNKPIVCLK